MFWSGDATQLAGDDDAAAGAPTHQRPLDRAPGHAYVTPKSARKDGDDT
jgi:hypothetical protein